MSVKVMGLALDSTVQAEWGVLVALANWANDAGEVTWMDSATGKVKSPAIRYLARIARTHPRTVQRHLRSLEKMGLLTITPREYQSSLYRLNVKLLRDLRDPAVDKEETPGTTPPLAPDHPRHDATPGTTPPPPIRETPGQEGRHDATPGTTPPKTSTKEPTPTELGAEKNLTPAQVVVGEWIDRCPKRPPKRVIGQVARYIGEMIDEGIEPDDVRRGLRAWMDKLTLAPSLIPAVVNETMNGNGNGQLRLVGGDLDLDAILGADSWRPPIPPIEIDNGPHELRRAWADERRAEHLIERRAQAEAKVARRRAQAEALRGTAG